MITVDEQLREDQDLAALEASFDQAAGAQPPAAPPRRTIFWLQFLAFGLGLGLLIFIINHVGLQPIFDALGRIGFGFFALLAISGSRHLFRTFAMSAAVPPEHRKFTLLQALAARLGGEAISFLTFTGPLLGEATKVALLRKRVPLGYGVSALVVDNLIYNVSVALFILSGACVMLVTYPLPAVVRTVLIGIAAGTAFGVLAFAFAARRRLMLLTWLVEFLIEIGPARNFLSQRREQVQKLESDAFDFYRHRRGAFFAMFGYNFLAHATSVYEVYATLWLLGFSPRVAASYIIESLTKVINFAFSFVPATIGVYEGGTELILRTLGYAVATGVTLAIVRKASTIFWTSIGLMILIWRAVPNAAGHLADRYPRLRKLMDNLVLANISHRPARTLTSVLGVALGVLLIVLTVGLANGILRERGRREGNIGAEIMVRASGTFGFSGSQPFSLPITRADEIKRIEGVRAAIPIGQNTVSSDSGFGSRLVDGIRFDEYAAVAGLRIIEGRGLIGGDEAIVDSIWKEDRKLPQVVGSTIQLYERPFRIVGVYEPPGGGRVKIPLATMQEQLGGENHCSTVLVSCLDPARSEEVAARIRERFPDDQIIFTRDLPELYASGVPALNIFLKVVVAIAATISVLVILLAMYTSVMERTRQIGILKSLGMSNRLIAWVVEQEALLVSALGVAVGILLSYAARYFIIHTTSLSIEIEPRWLLVALGIGLLGGTIGAIYPALRAARQDAVEALSYE
jgi:putative ABC transport system permease protein